MKNKINTAINNCKKLTLGERRALIGLYSFWSLNRNIYASHQYLSNNWNISKRTIQRAIAKFEKDLKIISVKRDRGTTNKINFIVTESDLLKTLVNMNEIELPCNNDYGDTITDLEIIQNGLAIGLNDQTTEVNLTDYKELNNETNKENDNEINTDNFNSLQDYVLYEDGGIPIDLNSLNLSVPKEEELSFAIIPPIECKLIEELLQKSNSNELGIYDVLHEFQRSTGKRLVIYMEADSIGSNRFMINGSSVNQIKFDRSEYFVYHVRLNTEITSQYE